jgi:hypothetical protein
MEEGPVREVVSGGWEVDGGLPRTKW